MNNKRKAASSSRNTGGGKRRAPRIEKAPFLHEKYITAKTGKQERRILSFLGNGPENARTARELSRLSGLTPRQITRIIEAARKKGVPICAATTKPNPGYYLTDDPAVLARYIRALDSRLQTIRNTRESQADTLDGLSGQLRL